MFLVLVINAVQIALLVYAGLTVAFALYYYATQKRICDAADVGAAADNVSQEMGSILMWNWILWNPLYGSRNNDATAVLMLIWLALIGVIVLAALAS